MNNPLVRRLFTSVEIENINLFENMTRWIFSDNSFPKAHKV